ncbi:MAG: glycoside hydrolase family 15 protein [Nocardioidaceae bacterium]
MVPFPPSALRDYAVLADGERGVLVGPHGELAWLCFPGWDDDAVFAGLVGGRGGYAVTPSAASFVWGGSYEDGSLVWRSRWVTTDSIIESREALALPSTPDRAVVLRRVEASRGDAVVRVVLQPAASFGRAAADDVRRAADGSWTARAGQVHLRWTGAAAARADDDGTLTLELRVPEGRHHDLVLELATTPFPDRPPDVDAAWLATERAWAELVPTGLHTWAERDVRHAYAVLHGLTAASGGMVAAATMSLPERARAGRNYDYRYVWLRDQAMAVQAVAGHGSSDLVDRAAAFVTERVLEDGPGLRPVYTVRGGTPPAEHTLDLPGYPGSRAVVGNAARDQFQVDVFGEVLELYAAVGRLDRLTSEHWRAVELTVEALRTRRHEPDAGIWELRRNGRWAHSQLISVAGLRAVAALAPPAQAADWRALADTVLAEATADCRRPDGTWQRGPEDPRVDASLLLPVIRGAVVGESAARTVDAVLRDLGDQHHLYRFRYDERPLAEAEGAFLLCGFHAALALSGLGRPVEAARWFERNRSATGPPRLFAEEYDVGQGQLRGNLPQAFVHAALIEAARVLAAAG